MSTFFSVWMFWNALLGGLLVTAGVFWARRQHSPVRRLRILEWTLVVSLFVPILASTQFSWHWPLKWLPAEAPAATIDLSSATGVTAPTKPIRGGDLPPDAGNSGFFEVAISDLKLGESTRQSLSSPAPSLGIARWPVNLRATLITIHVVAMGTVLCWWLLSVTALSRLWRQAVPGNARVNRLLAECQTGSVSLHVDVRVSQSIPTA